MKKIMIMYALTSLSNAAIARETMVNGFCTKEVLAMEKARHVDVTSSAVRGNARGFFEKSLAVAKDRYMKSPIYTGEWPVMLYKAEILFGKGPEGSDRRMLGTKIELHMDTDEDHITYYFYNESNSEGPVLKMYLHDEQSAVAFWPCE